MIQRIPVTSREQWLAERSKDVTASVVGGLRGLHPYTSRLKLYKQHTGFEFSVQPNVRMERGTLLEDAIAKRVGQQRPDWTIEKADVYLRDPDRRLGATPDFFVTDARGRRGILQTKLSIAGVFEREWKDETGAIIPPMWIRLQALTEAMLEDADFGAIGVWIDHPFRNDCEVFEFERHPGAEAAIRADVDQFWQDVAWGVEPEPSGSVDAELVKLLYPESREDVTVDLSGNNYLTDALAERARLKEQIGSMEDRVEEIETELRGAMREAVMARFNGFVVTLRTIDRAGFTAKPARYRKLNVSDLRPKEIKDDGEPTSF
jgi:predicted phage-related endonuclease